MRTPTGKEAFYAAPIVPETVDVEILKRWIVDELYKISGAIQALAETNLAQTHVAPERPRDGDTRLADGVNWNPGLGEGVYTYYNSTWNKLG